MQRRATAAEETETEVEGATDRQLVLVAETEVEVVDVVMELEASLVSTPCTF